MNWGNFECWGNFEHYSICSYNSVYCRNGRVYWKLHSCSLEVSIIAKISQPKCEARKPLTDLRSKLVIKVQPGSESGPEANGTP